MHVFIDSLVEATNRVLYCGGVGSNLEIEIGCRVFHQEGRKSSL